MVRLSRLIAVVILFVLAACTTQPVAQPTLAPEPTAAQATGAPPSSVPSTSQPTAVAATAAPAGSATIPTGQTAEGYNYLGSPSAPVTIVFYSDFF